MMTKKNMAITQINFTRNMTEGFSLASQVEDQAAGSQEAAFQAEVLVEGFQEAAFQEGDQADFLVEAQEDFQGGLVASRAEELQLHHHRNLFLKKHRHPLLQLIQVA